MALTLGPLQITYKMLSTHCSMVLEFWLQILTTHNNIQFSIKRKIIHSIYINNISIVYTDNICLLEMILDTKFSWTPHLKKLKISCNTKIKITKILSHHIWGADKNSLLLIFKALTLSRIYYGSFIYNSFKPNNNQILNLIHNHAIRLAIGAISTSPIDSIQCISGKPLLQIRRNKDLFKFVTK